MEQDDRRENRVALTRKNLLRGIGSAAMLAGATPLLGAAGGQYADLARLLDIDPQYAGKGLHLELGAVYPLTGTADLFGSHFSDVPDLAFKHIAALGGPSFDFLLKDNKTGDPQAGVDAVRELGDAKCAMELSSIAADFGSMIPGIEQYRILTLDGSGGTSVFAQGKPYFYGSIAITPNDAMPGVTQYIAAKMPLVRRVASVGWDLGTLSDQVAKQLEGTAAFKRIKLVADERTAIGETDYSDAIQKIKLGNPDLVFAFLYAEDIGYFLKQYATSGIGKPVFAFAHTAAAAKIAGPAYEGLYFAFDYFDAAHPPNPWSRFFVNEFSALEGSLPDFYAANAYEDIFILWECVRRVLKKGGNPKDGTQLYHAFQSDPSFPSVYGGSAAAVGSIVFNLETHSLRSRPMRVMRYVNGQVVTLATFNIGGTDFQFVS